MSQSNVSSVMTPETKAAIEAFAKSRKVPAAACLQVAAMALAMQPFEEVAINGTVSEGAKVVGKRIPRQAGAKSLEFREAVVAKAADLKGKRHTFSEVAAMFGIDQANAANNLKWLQSHNKIDFRIVGHATKQQGQKGRAPAIIEFV